YEIVAANLFGEPRRRVSDRIPCYALFVDPPLGRVGLTEHDALAQGHAIRIGTRPMTRVARAAEKGETRGLMKVVIDARSNLILGASILGVGADEAIHSIIDVMAARDCRDHADRGDGPLSAAINKGFHSMMCLVMSVPMRSASLAHA